VHSVADRCGAISSTVGLRGIAADRDHRDCCEAPEIKKQLYSASLSNCAGLELTWINPNGLSTVSIESSKSSTSLGTRAALR
jgi:hypothetical protein